MYTYKIYNDRDGRKVILCIRRYRDKTIKGKAICHPSDNYNEEIGKELARKRCESNLLARKIRDKYAYKEKLYIDSRKAYLDYERAEETFKNTCNQYAKAQEAIISILNELGV